MSLIVHQPQAGAPKQLFLLFHGVGAAPDDLVPLGRIFAQQFPQSAIVSVQAPHDCPYSSGYQWFSVEGITEEQRPIRSAQAMPVFIQTVQQFQQAFGVNHESTALVGFLKVRSWRWKARKLAQRWLRASSRCQAASAPCPPKRPTAPFT